MNRVRLMTGSLLLAALFGIMGCGEKLYTAGGKVLVDGKPVDEGTIMFHPDSGGRTASGRIMKGGVFTLEFRNPGDGLPAGEYKVTIIADIWIEGKRTKQQELELEMMKKNGINDPDSVGTTGQLIHVVPEEYNHPTTSPLKQKVESKSDQQFTFDIPSKKK